MWPFWLHHSPNAACVLLGVLHGKEDQIIICVEGRWRQRQMGHTCNTWKFLGWGRIGATAADLHHSHSNMGSKAHLRPTPQLTAMPNPRPTEQGEELNPNPHGYQSDSFWLHHNGSFQELFNFN